MKRAVLDTNVIVSAMLSPFGAPAGILNVVFAGELKLLTDDRIAAEYGEVLRRKKFGFDPSSISDILDYIEAIGERILALPLKVRLPDRFDLPFLEVAIAGRADYLITGNRRHFPQRLLPSPLKLATPDEFLAGR